MCVVPYTSFCVSDCYFTKTLPNLWWFWWLQNLVLHTITYMLYDQLFWSIPHLFFHNAITFPELKFIFKHLKSYRLLVSRSLVLILVLHSVKVSLCSVNTSFTPIISAYCFSILFSISFIFPPLVNENSRLFPGELSRWYSLIWCLWQWE